ncbi:MAG TPA: XdhC family protein [Anaerolineales bacterium]|nr:XdhC family protein [Anaerolineales bacterium]
MSIYTALAELEKSNRPGVLCTIISSQGSTPRHTGSKMLVYPDGRFIGTVGGGEMENRVIAAALEALKTGAARQVAYNMSDPERGDPGVCGGQLEIFIEPILPRSTLIVVGAGHVGLAVAHLAKWLGFYVIVSDDRPDFATAANAPEADEFFTGPLAELPAAVEITPWTYIVLTTRGVPIDVAGLPALLQTPAPYIGAIGSRRRWQTTYQELRDQGLPVETLDRVRSPIGLELHAETPKEIAVSILAEIILMQRGAEQQTSGAAKKSVG